MIKMTIDIPAGKALIAVTVKENTCRGCFFALGGGFVNCKGMTYKYQKGKRVINEVFEILPCRSGNRKDGKNVIFKMVNFKK